MLLWNICIFLVKVWTRVSMQLNNTYRAILQSLENARFDANIPLGNLAGVLAALLLNRFRSIRNLKHVSFENGKLFVLNGVLSISCEVPVLTWWRHQMITFSTLLTLCAGNSPVTGAFPSQRPVTRSFDAFFHLRLNKSLSKQSWGWWFETPSCSSWRHCIGSRWLDSHTLRMPHVSIHYSERLSHLKSPEIVLFGEKLICSII